MTPSPGNSFAPEADQPIAYMQRTRDWYLALGYGNPYVWAHHADAPFQPLKNRSRARAWRSSPPRRPYQPDKGNQGPGAAYNTAAKVYSVYSGDTSVDHDLRIAHVAIDRKHTSMEDSDYCNPERLSLEEIRRLREESERARETARAMRETSLIA